ncbi:MAG TPA: hypothetical protein VLA96_00075 [Terriglobales bacterium]|nr:hypothetical protein [Terriglobales bacterium]
MFDSQTPSLFGFGTVWLPLPHVLILPFIVPLGWWQSGVGGSVYSMAAYVLACVGLYRLTLRLTESRAAAGLAAAVFALNPNLLYMQATAMTESLYLALFLWATAYFTEFVEESRSPSDGWGPATRRSSAGESPAPTGEDGYRRASRAATKCGLCIAAMVLTRYDGWFAGPFFVAAALAVLVRRRGWQFLEQKHAPLWRGVRNLALIALAAPVFWLAYNWVLNGHPLDFALGPYSAKAIAERTSTPGVFHPGHHDLWVAQTFVRKAAEMNLAEGAWQHVLFFGALACLGIALTVSRRWLPVLLLWLPWAFYALSVAYGSVPIFLPVWWPHSYYNVRYGLQLLPAVAVSLGLMWALAETTRLRYRAIANLAQLVIVVAALGPLPYVWRATPITLREAQANGKRRVAVERMVAETLRELPAESRIMVYLGEHGGALQQAGIPLKRTINESTHLRSEMPHGLWERALEDPKPYADVLVAFPGDPVARAAGEHKADLLTLTVIDYNGEEAAVLYAVKRAR